MAFLVCENLEYLYSMGTPFQTAALDDVSLEIEKGELVGIRLRQVYLNSAFKRAS